MFFSTDRHSITEDKVVDGSDSGLCHYSKQVIMQEVYIYLFSVNVTMREREFSVVCASM